MERLPSYLCNLLSILELFRAGMELGECIRWGFEMARRVIENLKGKMQKFQIKDIFRLENKFRLEIFI